MTMYGSKFTAKCDLWIERTIGMTEVSLKTRRAVENDLYKDIAKLLRIGLDTYAYSKAEELFAEQNQILCYNLINLFCWRILGHLPCMRKKRECPEQCEEAVSSLIFAAARISQAPELTGLGNILKKRYENILESSVNEEFAAKFELKSSSKDIKLQLLREISQRFSIKWESRALEQKLSNIPLASNQKIGSENSAKGHGGVSSSSQPDMPKSRHVHPKLPDINEFHARFRALWAIEMMKEELIALGYRHIIIDGIRVDLNSVMDV